MADAPKREGPRITVNGTCEGCRHERSVHYAVQGDSGFDVSCAHPSAPKGGRIGDSMWTTPQWCPFLSAAIRAAIPEQKEER